MAHSSKSSDFWTVFVQLFLLLEINQLFEQDIHHHYKMTLNTRFPLPALQGVRYSVKLIFYNYDLIYNIYENICILYNNTIFILISWPEANRGAAAQNVDCKTDWLWVQSPL